MRIIAAKKEEEKQTVRLMVELYCRHKLKCKEMPTAYRELADYACRRLDHCRWKADKPTCRRCPVHCYSPEKRELIRAVMRWTGPRMIIYAPMAALRHLFS